FLDIWMRDLPRSHPTAAPQAVDVRRRCHYPARTASSPGGDERWTEPAGNRRLPDGAFVDRPVRGQCPSSRPDRFNVASGMASSQWPYVRDGSCCSLWREARPVATMRSIEPRSPTTSVTLLFLTRYRSSVQ